MKRKVLIISFCALALSVNAQFKVQSDGKIAIQTTSTAQSPISINGVGNSSTYISCNVTGKSGITLSTYGSNGNTMVYGGYFSTTNAGQHASLRGHANGGIEGFGVMGYANAMTKSIGLWGSIPDNSNKGAAVYGTITGDMGTALATGDVYAGFFNGNVKVKGNFVVSTTLQGALLGESASGSSSSGGSLSLRSASVAGSLSGLCVTTFQKERPAPPEKVETIYDLDGDTLQRGGEPEPDIIDVQYYGKTHYALDADRLEEAFPDLVYETKDGTKMINYMEMIPLLVQSINELSAKIEVLEGQTSEGAARKARTTTDIQKSLSGNRLYQNTPNPFKEQTVIRFSLADDVQSAAICIFDMTGKTIRKMPVSSGMESVSVGGYELGEGMFLYSLIVNGQEIDTKRMIISK